MQHLLGLLKGHYVVLEKKVRTEVLIQTVSVNDQTSYSQTKNKAPQTTV